MRSILSETMPIYVFLSTLFFSDSISIEAEISRFAKKQAAKDALTESRLQGLQQRFTNHKAVEETHVKMIIDTR